MVSTSQFCATFCIQVPEVDRMLADHSNRKFLDVSADPSRSRPRGGGATASSGAAASGAAAAGVSSTDDGVDGGALTKSRLPAAGELAAPRRRPGWLLRRRPS